MTTRTARVAVGLASLATAVLLAAAAGQPQEAGPAARILEKAPPALPLAGAPPGWEVREFSGKATVTVVRDEGAVALRLLSQGNSFAVTRSLDFDLPKYPILTWKWKVTALPKGGDVRKRETDDAVQVYVVFPRGLVKAVQSHIVGYIWDATAPPGTRVDSPQPCPPTCNLKLIVLQGGPEKLGQWLTERRNVLEDYKALFGGAPPRVGGLSVQLDSNDTKSSAEAFFQDFVFQAER